MYYYNETTDESRWDPPEEGYIPVGDDAETSNQEEGSSESTKATELVVKKSSTAATAKKKLDWTAHTDDDGKIYYYNDVTKASAWDAPEEGFNEPEEAAKSETKAAKSVWVKYQDDDGRDYYYNQETEETSWEQPDGYIENAPVDDDVTKSPGAAAMDIDSPTSSSPPSPPLDVKEEEAEEEEPVEPEIDPAVKKLQDAESALQQTDSVLEPSCLSNVGEVVAANDGNPGKAVQSLIANYHGQSAICGLLAKWLMDLNRAKVQTSSLSLALTTKPSIAGPKLPNARSEDTCAEAIREAAQTVIIKIAKERFTKDVGDAILNLSKTEAAFLEDMINSKRWRKLLIDLSAVQKDSAVLLYCLRAISARGHHREIAKRMNQSDHFAVFNAMLQSELAVIGSQAIAAGSDIAAATTLSEVIDDLRKACCATEYTYVYSVELLRRLQSVARDLIQDESNARFLRVVRKWEALSEGLEKSMMDPAASMSASGTSPIFRKRRLDLALTLQERTRRRQRISHESSSNMTDSPEISEALDTAMLTLLRRHSVGIQVNDGILDQLLPSGIDLDTSGIGELFLCHPLAIQALLGHLYKPGATRSNAPSIRNKCARLIAITSISAESKAKKEMQVISTNNSIDDSKATKEEDLDEIALSRIIGHGSTLCEQLETVISFSVVSVTGKSSECPASPGQRLCNLATTYPPVGMGVMFWAMEFTKGHEFATSASFATLSISILALVRRIAVSHPFARSDALQIALIFLHHSNSDVTYQKINAIKKCSLRLLLHLFVQGDVVQVLRSVTNRLTQTGTTDLDASLIRYFVSGVLDVVQPPVSPVLIRCLGTLLKSSRVLDAVRSSYFSVASKTKLTSLLTVFDDAKLYNGSDLDDTDKEQIRLVINLYI